MAGLGAFVAGLGSGYLRGQQQQLENERQAKRDAMLDEQFKWQREQQDELRTDRENKRALEKAVTDIGQAGQVDNNAAAVTYANPNGEQKTAYQPDMQTADYAAQQQRLEEGASPEAPAVQSNPAAQTASSVRTLDGGRKLFTGLTAAQQAKQYSDENPVGSYAKYMALSERLAGMAGGQEMADKYLERAKKAEKEGAFKTLNMLEAGNMDGALKAWNSTGGTRMQPGQTFSTIANKDGTKVHQVLNSDGSVAVANVENAILNYIGGIEGVTSRAAGREKLKNEMALKTWEYQNDPSKRYINTKPGSEVFDTVSGKNVTQNTMDREPVMDAAGNQMRDADGDLMFRHVPKGSTGKQLLTFADAAFKHFDDTFKNKTDDGWTQEQLVQARNLSGQIAQDSRLQGPAAVDIATRVVKNPALLQYGIDPATGQMAKVYKDANYPQAIPVYKGVSTAGMKPDDYKSAATAFLAAQPDKYRSDYVKAAYDPKAREVEIGGIKTQAMNAVAEKMKLDPSITQAQAERMANELVQQKTAAFDNTLAAIREGKINLKDYEVPAGGAGAPGAPGNKPGIKEALKGPSGLGAWTSGTPNYAEWIKAKDERDQLLKNASKMSPDRREAYLAPRLPQVENRIKFNENYKTY